MRWEVKFREIVSGERRGLFPATARGLLAVGEFAYGLGIRLRNARFDRRGRAVQRVEVPVISVGNITTGGTGKTPLTAWIAQRFVRLGLRAGIVSRGYGASHGERNDEARELEILLPGTPHVQNADRIAAVREAVDRFSCQAIVLDDAFQHRRLHRDLDIVLIDALAPFGYGRLLPRGLLREPLSSLGRADVIAVTRADLITEVDRNSIVTELRKHAPRALLVDVAHRAQSLMDPSGEGSNVTQIAGENVAAFCGIGNPLGFRRTLERCGASIAAFREFSDHHVYDAKERSELAAWSDTLDVSAVLCTMKDFVKLRDDWRGRHPLRALVIGIELLSARDEFEARIDALLTR